MNPPRSRTFPSLLEELAEAHPDAEAVVDDGGAELSFAELATRARRIAAGLAECGIRPGDKVGILMENRVEWVESMFGALAAGATVVGISTWVTRDELAYFISHSGIDVLLGVDSFAGNDYATMLGELLGDSDGDGVCLPSDEFPTLHTVVILGRDVAETIAFEDLMGEAASTPSDPTDPDDVALLLYTSGSTSKPKGVPLLHGDIIENAFHIGERLHLRADDRVWLASPLFWSYGSANALTALFTHRGSVALQAPFDPEVAVEMIDERDCTVYYGMPNMAQDIVAADAFEPDRIGFRTGTTIGPPEDVAFTIDELGVPTLCNVYGSTETYGNCAVTDADLDRSVRLTTQGRPLPGQEIQIKDPKTGEPLPDGEIGEICVRGRVTPGYHDDPEKTAEAFDDEGYFHMGDLGRLDDAGRVTFKGRLKSMLKIGGINVSPLEVEELLREHPGIENAFVLGLDDPEMGEVVAAVVVPSDETLTREDVDRHSEKLSAYKRPREVTFADLSALPKTDTGKIRKRELRDLFESRGA